MALLAPDEILSERTIALPDLNVDVSSSGAVAVVRLTGRLGPVEVDSLALPLLRLTASRCVLAVFDLSALRSVSCLALGALEEFRRGLARWGGRVALAAPRPAVLAAFESSGLLERFPVFDNTDDALDAAA